MSINTKKVKNRRQVRYGSLEELRSDAQRLVSTQTTTLGNWSQGQLYQHLAQSLDSSIDGVDFSLPAPVRWVFTLLMKKKFLEREIPPGFKGPPSDQLPDTITAQEGLESLCKAIDRQAQVAQRAPHPAFGDIGREGWNAFNLRHAEMHMSFLVEADAEADLD